MNSLAKPETRLVSANRKLREARYEDAIEIYQRILIDQPEMAKWVGFNLNLARERLSGKTIPAALATDTAKVSVTQADQSTLKPESKAAHSFDPDYYLHENEDVQAAGIDPEAHFWSNGEREGRKPNQWFDPAFYYKLNADVRSAGISAFRHYIDSGRHEGRASHSPLQDNDRVTTTAKPLLFVGHDGVLAGSEIVLLEVVRWFHNHTTRPIKLLLLAPGPVADRYAKFADVYVLPGDGVDHPGDLKEFMNEGFEFAYLNTVVAGRLFPILKELGITLGCDVITHIHEMEKVLATFPSEMDALLCQTKHWISASPASSATLESIYDIAPEILTTVPAFINPVARQEAATNEFQLEARNELGLSPNAFVVIGCGTLYERKGPDLFLETARLLKQKTAQPIEFLWMGQGPDRDVLEGSLTAEEKVWIHFAGNRNNANKLLAAADVFFMSSREDPFPLVVLESAQHAVPTVCFEPATGITAFIEDDAGIAVPDIDTQMASDALLNLLEHPHQRKALGDTARRKLFENYTTKQQNQKIFRTVQRATGYKPSVSVIVPFYNHERFIEERLNSILSQPIKDIEIIALDDCSTDGTIERIRPYLEDGRITLVENDTNSGSPFKQWEKGIRLASGDVVWIAEGDDSCDSNFLQTLLPYFDDPMVNIASAKTEIIDEHGNLKEDALMPYLDMAYPGKFSQSYLKDGFQEINEQLGAMCTLVNASGLLIRKSSFGATLTTAQGFKMCGDWLIYLECLKGGKIAYDVNTHNYFRRHSASQVHKVEGTAVYFQERFAITDYVAENFIPTRRLLKKAFDAIDHEWNRFLYKNEGKPLDDVYDKNEILDKSKVESRALHVAFYVHGMTFSQGGIERLAAQLGNFLVERGWKVTIFCRIHSNKAPVYPLYESIRVIPVFDENRLEWSVKQLNEHLCHSDIDVFVPMLSEWLFEPVVHAAQNTGVMVIASEHNDPWKIEELWWNHEDRIKCFEKVDVIHFLLKKYTKSVPEYLQHKVVDIPNGVHLPDSVVLDGREKLIVSVGRLVPQKRFDRLIEAAGLAQNSLRENGYRIEIYGEGSLHEELSKQISTDGLGDLVILKGQTSKIEEVYQRADFFVLASDFEGLPVTLLEAFAHGLPSIGFESCNGPNEIIQHNKNGFLVDSVSELGDRLAHLAKYNISVDMREHALSRAQEYSIQNFLSNWYRMITEVIYEK